MIHELKTWPEYFEAVKEGRKTFEIRCDDRMFLLGERLRLQEWDREEERYTGRELLVVVTYKTEFGCAPGFVCMSIRRLEPSESA